MYSVHNNDYSFMTENLELLINYYKNTEEEHKTNTGLFWSIDNNDAMEYSISGTTEDLVPQKGIRPTLNSYMAANAYAISEIALKAGKDDIAKKLVRRMRYE